MSDNLRDDMSDSADVVVHEIRLTHAGVDRVLGYEVIRGGGVEGEGGQGLGMFGTLAEARAFRDRVAAQPFMQAEVVVDHRPGETCSVAAEVDPETGFARQPVASRERVAEVLRWLAAGRKLYCHRCPESQNDMHEMTPAELAVHAEHAAADWLADIIAGTNNARGWLHSRHGDEWPALAAGVFREPPTREQFAILLHSFDGFAIETGERWSDCNEDRQGAFLYQADAVLALTN